MAFRPLLVAARLVSGSILLASCGPTSTPARMFVDPPDLAMVKFDPTADNDKDGYTPAKGDCNDHDATIHPGATEICFDHIDQDCDGIADELCDDDKDGYAIKAGGMLPGNDCDDSDPYVNPGAYEVQGNMRDDDCDGKVDNTYPACDKNLVGSDALTYANALDLCGPWLKGAAFEPTMDKMQRRMTNHFGAVYTPRSGETMIALSTGLAGDEQDHVTNQRPGTAFLPTVKNPLQISNHNICIGGGAQLASPYVNDLASITLTLQVPTNAKAFTFKFNFFSAEYYENVGKAYNDEFIVALTSGKNKSGKTENVSFDTNGDPVTVNTGFFTVCDSTPICSGISTPKGHACGPSGAKDLNGTGYEQLVMNNVRYGGATGWLTTTAPVLPGEIITLQFSIFDAGDHILDSAVLIDAFAWLFDDAVAGTVPGVM